MISLFERKHHPQQRALGKELSLIASLCLLFFVLLILLAFWEHREVSEASFLLSWPSEIIESFVRWATSKNAFYDLGASLKVVWVTPFAVLLGTVCGALFSIVLPLRKILSWTMGGIGGIPKIGVWFVLLVWFGFDPIAKIPYICYATAIPSAIWTFLSGIDVLHQQERGGPHKAILEHADANLGVTKFWLLRFVLYPALLPQLFSNLKIGFQTSWASLIVIEMTGPKVGIGNILNRGMTAIDIPFMFVGMFVISGLSILSWIFIAYLEKKILGTEKRGGRQEEF